MSAVRSQSDELQTRLQRLWPLSWKRILLVSIAISTGLIATFWRLGLPLSSYLADYDRKAYARIRWAIEINPQRRLGERFDIVSNELGLELVPWDDASVQQEPGMYRIYHFHGFALYITLMRLPPGITPDSLTPWTSSGEELESHGVLWLAHQRPFVLIDGFRNRQERMTRYWKAVNQGIDQINADMKRKVEIEAPLGSKIGTSRKRM